VLHDVSIAQSYEVLFGVMLVNKLSEKLHLNTNTGMKDALSF